MKFEPDFNTLRKALLKEGIPSRIPSWELMVDEEIVESIIGRALIKPKDSESIDKYLDQIIEFQLKMGYDYLPVAIDLPLPRSNILFGEDTAEISNEKRVWLDEHNGMINSWEDFEKYPWQDTSAIDYRILEKAVKKLPEGMKVSLRSTGVLENVQWLMGYEPMSFATIDEPELIIAMFEKIGKLLISLYENASQLEGVGLLAMGDDLGFKNGTLFSPDFLRTHVFPLQKKCVDAAHKNNHPFILHSCGKMDTIIDDLIDFVGIDGKHSYEDVILPVEEAIKLYGNRVAIVGGMDIDFLARSTELEIRKRVRSIIEQGSRGGYVLGSGNSIANYIPVKNYIAMMDEARK